jgi:hypothetical protein
MELMCTEAQRNGHWTFHDFGSTAARHMFGIAPPVVENIMAHTSASFGGFVDVYHHYELVVEKHSALAWGKWLTALTAKESAHVIILQGAVG